MGIFVAISNPFASTLIPNATEPKHDHVVHTLQHPPTSPCPILSTHREPISVEGYQKLHHEAESPVTSYEVIIRPGKG